MKNGLNFSTVLFVVFLVLKLTNTIDWSWWWVTAPLWLPFTCFLLLFIVCIFVLGFTETINTYKDFNKK